MTLLAMAVACHYTHTSPVSTFLYIWIALAGSYMSYHFRQSKQLLISLISVLGLIGVLAWFGYEMFNQFMQVNTNLLPPFIHVLAGLLALHTFDLRGRSDIATNVLIGFVLLCCALIVGRDLNLGLIVCGYIWLMGALLYYSCASTTRANGRYTPAEPSSPAQIALKREMRGTAFVPISLIPILSVLFFMCLPRVNSLFDWALGRINGLLNPAPIAVAGGSSSSTGIVGTGGSGRAYQSAAIGTGSGAAGSIAGAHSTLGKPGKTAGAGEGLSQGGMAQGSLNGSDSTAAGAGKKKGAKGKSASGVKSGNESGAKGEKQTGETAQQGQPEMPAPPEGELVFRNKKNAVYDNDLLFTVKTAGDYYYKRIVLDNYDGHKWTVSKSTSDSKCRRIAGSNYQELGGVPSLFLPASFHGTQVTQEITIKSNLGHLIPAAAVPQRLVFPSDPIVVDDNGILHSDTLLKPNVTFTVFSEVPNYNLEEMRHKSEASPPLEASLRKEYGRYLQINADLPQEVKDTAREVAGNDPNWFTRAERMCKYLRTNYTYSVDGDDVPADRDLVDAFLFGPRKSGACGPFASAFAIMCRSIGIPARVIGGFAPGEFDGTNNLRKISAKHGHAWVEAYIPHFGWVPFDATPSGVLPAPPEEDNSFIANVNRNLQQFETMMNPGRQAKDNQAQAPGGTNAGNKPVPPPNSSFALPNPLSKAARGMNKGSESKDTQAQPEKKPAPAKDAKSNPLTTEKAQTFFRLLVQGIIILGLIPTLLLLAQIIRAIYLSLKNRRQIDHDAKPSTILYLRVVDDLKRFKIKRSPSDTAEDFTVRFLHAVDNGMSVHPELPPLLQHFMDVYADDRFGSPADSLERTKQLDLIRQEIHTLVRKRSAHSRSHQKELQSTGSR